MNKLLSTLFALSVACATGLAQAQTPAASAPAAAPAAAAPAAAPAPKQAPAGAKSVEAKVAMCIGCHGIKGYQASFPEVYKVPMISGQSAKYITAALAAYKTGDRKHPTMRGIAESLTEQDIADISTYYENLGRASRKAAAEKPSREPNAQVTALLRLGRGFDVPLQQRHVQCLGHFLGQHGLAGARLPFHQQRPLQGDGCVDRQHQVLRGDVVL